VTIYCHKVLVTRKYEFSTKQLLDFFSNVSSYFLSLIAPCTIIRSSLGFRILCCEFQIPKGLDSKFHHSGFQISRVGYSDSRYWIQNSTSVDSRFQSLGFRIRQANYSRNRDYLAWGDTSVIWENIELGDLGPWNSQSVHVNCVVFVVINLPSCLRECDYTTSTSLLNFLLIYQNFGNFHNFSKNRKDCIKYL